MTNLQAVIPDEVLPVYALAWHRALADVPTNRLDEYYLRAFKRKSSGFAVTATDIIAEWNRLKDQRHYEDLIEQHEEQKRYEQYMAEREAEDDDDDD